MNYKLYGFVIGQDIHVDIANKRLYRLSTSGKDRSFTFSTVCFNDTMMQLFLYLLIHGRGRIISRDELLTKIWQENDLVPSAQRLWQVFTDLNGKMSGLGMPEGFIRHVKRNGYTVSEEMVTPLYYKMSDISALNFDAF